jgi:hypothetical protein
MATEEAKIANRARMWGLTTMGLGMGIWEMVAEASSSLSPIVGNQILAMVEKQLGLEIAGEKPEDILTELGRIFIDEFGFGTEVIVERNDKKLSVTIKNAVGTPEMGILAKMGVGPFMHPFLCCGLSALGRLGLKARADLKPDVPNNVTTVIYDIV